jgi:hypothetical protein
MAPGKPIAERDLLSLAAMLDYLVREVAGARGKRGPATVFSWTCGRWR